MTFPTLTPTGYHCPVCDTPYPTATESVICQLIHSTTVPAREETE